MAACGGPFVRRTFPELESHHKNKGHESTEHCEQDVPALIAEAAPSLKEDEC